MLKALFRAIDGLFYETTTVTTRTIKRTYSNPETMEEIRNYCFANNIKMDTTSSHRWGESERRDMYHVGGELVSASDFEKATDLVEGLFGKRDQAARSETTIVADEDQFMVGDKVIAIPENIRNMLPIDKVDTFHFSAFPKSEQDHDPIMVMLEEPNNRQTACYGFVLGEGEDHLFTHSYIRDKIEQLIDISGSDEATVAVAHYQEMSITSVIYNDADFLLARTPEGRRISIAIGNARDEKDYVEDVNLSVTAACIFARTILLTFIKGGHSITRYNEHDLRSTILALLVADRSVV